MLEHVPEWLGRMLRSSRAGHEGLVAAQADIRLGDATFDLESLAFADGARLPVRFTADGDGVSPPLRWSGVPDGTAALALIVEDPDAPAPKPLVHAILWGIAPGERAIAEGAIGADGPPSGGGEAGRNSYLQTGWLPPDPPTGHGEHAYVFQLFALSAAADLGGAVGRTAFVEAIAGNVLATALLTGTYSREAREAEAGDVAVATPLPATE